MLIYQLIIIITVVCYREVYLWTTNHKLRVRVYMWTRWVFPLVRW